MKIITNLTVLLLAVLLLCGNAQALQPWEWRTPTVPGQVFPTKQAAAEAMRASQPYFAILNIENGPEVTSSQQVFTYTAPDVPAAISPWRYISHVLRSTEHDTEQEAKEATINKLAEKHSAPSCPSPYITKESAWNPRGYFHPPLSEYTRYESKSLAIRTWHLSPDGQCVERNQTDTFNYSIYRSRTFGCQAQEPYKGHYASNYNRYTKQGDIWSCYYGPKAQVIGSPLLRGCTEGNPCSTYSGDKSQTETDYQSPTLTFSRHYHSLAQGESSDLGVGWSHNYSDRLSFFSSGRLQGVIFGSGYQVPLIAKQGGTTYYQTRNKPAIEVRQDPEGWVLYRAQGGRDIFDAQGRLVRREDINGRITYILRDATTGHIDQVKDVAGRALGFEYDPQSGRLQAVIDPAGGRIAFGYDAANNLIQVDYPDSRSRHYLYEDTRFPYALTGIIDENGQRFSTYTYDEQGRAASSEHAGGAGRITLEYAVASGFFITTTVTDALNQQRIYDYTLSAPNKARRMTRRCADCGSGLVRNYSYGYGVYPLSIRDERSAQPYRNGAGYRCDPHLALHLQ